MTSATSTQAALSSWPLGYRWFALPFVAKLAVRDLRSHRLATVVGAATGFVGGLALAGVGGSIGPVALQSLAAVLLAVVPAALAGGTHPDQRHQADVVFRQGCRRTLIRLAAWAGAVAVVAVPAWIGSAVGSIVTDQVGRDAHLESAWWGLVLPALGAWVTAGTRLPERTDRSAAGTVTASLVRVVGGVAILLPGAWLPTTAVSGLDLDLLFPLGLLLTVAGLAVLSPLAVGAGVHVSERVPSTVVRVAAGVLGRNRRALSLPFALIAGATCLLVVQSVVGVGLGRRERDRLIATESLGPATVGTSPNQLVVALLIFDPSGAASAADEFKTQAAGLADAVGKASPGATVAPVQPLDLEVRPGRPVYGDIGSDAFDRVASAPQVAVATPTLLRVLRLDPALAAGERAVVLDPRLPDARGQLRLVRRRNDGTVLDVARVPAQLGLANRVVVGVPSVLLPADIAAALGPDDPAGESTSLDLRSGRAVVSFPTRPDEATVRLLRSATGGRVTRGDQAVDLSSTRRTDDIDSISTRTHADASRLLASLGLLCLAVVFVAQLALALAHRREDEVLDLLGTRRRTRVLVATVRGLIIGLVATGAGACVALSATAWGLHRYNSTGRFGDDATLAPVPFTLPAPLVVGLVALPLAAGLAGALVAAARRSTDDLTRSERLAW